MDYGIFNSPVLACTQILIYARGPELGFCCCFADGLSPAQSLVPSVAQANIKDVRLYYISMVNFLLAFKCIILQNKGQKKINVPVFFPKKIKPKSTVFQYIACKKL